MSCTGRIVSEGRVVGRIVGRIVAPSSFTKSRNMLLKHVSMSLQEVRPLSEGAVSLREDLFCFLLYHSPPLQEGMTRSRRRSCRRSSVAELDLGLNNILRSAAIFELTFAAWHAKATRPNVCFALIAGLCHPQTFQ